jgi:hypothetical protein
VKTVKIHATLPSPSFYIPRGRQLTKMTPRDVDATCTRHALRPGPFPLRRSRLTSRVASVFSNPCPHITHTRRTSQRRHERRMVRCRGRAAATFSVTRNTDPGRLQWRTVRRKYGPTSRTATSLTETTCRNLQKTRQEVAKSTKTVFATSPLRQDEAPTRQDVWPPPHSSTTR